MKQYDVIIIGAGPGGIFSAYELINKNTDIKIAVFEAGNQLENRKCPIDGKKVKNCVHCKTCAIMNGFGGAGAFSDGKYNITNEFGGTLYEYIGKKEATTLMEYVDQINLAHGGDGTTLYSTSNSSFKRVCLQNNLHLLNASVRHLGTDKNYAVLGNLYQEMKEKIDFFFLTPVHSVHVLDNDRYEIITEKKVIVVINVLFRLAEAAVNGWRGYVKNLRYQLVLIEWILGFELNFQQKSLPRLQMSYTRVMDMVKV